MFFIFLQKYYSMKKYLLLVATLISIAFFYRGIPLDILHSHHIAFVLVGGIISTVLLAATIFQFYRPIAVKKIGQKDDTGCMLMVFIVVFFFGYSIFLIFDETRQVSKEIQTNGKYTTGFIIDGSSYTTRRADFTNVSIKYKTQEGKEYITVHDISAKEFENYTQFQEIPIVYSSKYPTLIRILRSDSEIAKYSKRTIRDLKISDFEKILDLKSATAINDYLNAVNLKWTVENDNEANSFVFVNNYKKAYLKVILGEELIYMPEDNVFNLFNDEINQNYHKTSENESVKGSLYTKPGYILNCRIERIRENSDDSMIGSKQISVLEILKTK